MGVKRQGGGGSRSTSEPDVCRSLTGVAEGAVPDHGELRGASSAWEVGGRGREGKGLARSFEGMGSGWRASKRIRGREQGWNGAWEPGLPAAGILPHSRVCSERTLLLLLPYSWPLARCHRVNSWEGEVSLVRSGEVLKQEIRAKCSTLLLIRPRFHVSFLTCETGL